MYRSVWALMSRCLRVDDRSIAIHAFRCALLLFVLLILISASFTADDQDAAGLSMFQQLSHLNLVFIIAAMFGLFCSAISEEREEMTLGLLAMAGVRPLALLLGKFLPRLTTVATLLVAQLPFVFLCVTLGGISVGQIVASVVSWLSFLLFVASLGLFCSVIASNARAASTLAAAALFAYFVGPFITSAILDGFVSAGWVDRDMWWARFVELTCAGFYRSYAFWQNSAILSTGGDVSLMNLQTLSNSAAGVCLFCLAWTVFRFWPRLEAPAVAVRSLRSVAAARNTSRVRSFRRPGRAWDAPLVWKDFHFIAGSWPTLIGAGLLPLAISLLSGATLVASGETSISVLLQAMTGVVMGTSATITALQSCGLAARVFADEVRQLTLASLVMLPRSLPELLWGKVAGCSVAMLPSVGLCVLTAMAMIIMNLETLVEEISWVWWPAPFEVGAMIARLFFFWHLVAWLSLHVKWGVLPLACVAYVMLATVGGIVRGLIFAPVIFQGIGDFTDLSVMRMVNAVMTVVLSVGGSIILESLIASRIRKLAGQS